MKLFEIFKSKKLQEVSNANINGQNTFQFNLPDIDPLVVAETRMKENDFVGLWIKPSNPHSISIFAPRSVGGSGYLGIIPEYIYKNIFERVVVNVDGEFRLKKENISGRISSLTNNSCFIALELYTDEQVLESKLEYLRTRQNKIREDLSKKSSIKVPVILKFRDVENAAEDFTGISLNVPDPAELIEAGEYWIELVNDKQQLIAKGVGGDVKRIVRALISDQKFDDIKIEVCPNQYDCKFLITFTP